MSSIKYFIYARKSTEAEDKQVSSIEDQVAEVERIAEVHGLEVVDIISEAKSAKTPGRKAFGQMLKRIQKGEAQGILCWKLNRLARNPVDGGSISMMLQQGVLKHVQTYERSYYPKDNVLMMLIEFGMANQFVKDLSIDVRRGLARKAERGWYPSRTLPVGYIHNPERNIDSSKPEILPHHASFDIVKRLWKLLLTGEYNMIQLKELGDKLGLVNVKGRTICLTSYRRIFDNPFYYGYFDWKGLEGDIKTYKGKHESMITKKEFETAQIILGNRCVAHRKEEFPSVFKSLFFCGRCSSMITRETVDRAYCLDCKVKFSIKNKKYCPSCNTPISKKSQFTFLNKTYFRCTKKINKKEKCSEPYFSKSDIEKWINDFINKISISEGFYQWALKALPSVKLKDPNKEIKTRLEKELKQIKSRLKGYYDMRAEKEISAENFREFQKELEDKINQIEDQIEDVTTSEANVKEEVKKHLELTCRLKQKYQKADLEKKREIIRKFGLNPTITKKTPYFSKAFLLTTWSDIEKKYQRYIKDVEPKKSYIDIDVFDDSNPVFSALCRGMHLARTQIE